MASWLVSSLFSSSNKNENSSSTTSSIDLDDESKKQETIERFCERLQTAIRIDDRRDALRSLKKVSKKWKLEVATQAMNCLTEVLNADRSELDSIRLVLEILINLMTFDPLDDQEQKNLPNDITVQFTEVFIKNKEHLRSVLDLIEEIDFNVRRTSIIFLRILLKNCRKKLQELILENDPMSAAKLVDLLHDEREVIRNEAILLIEIFIESNGIIQKIVAFENGFERIFEILTNEAGCRGDIVVEDCLNVLLNLLKNNPSNQSFFRESSYIRRLAEFFQPNAVGLDQWTKQKNRNFILLLQVIRTLVLPTNSNQNLLACQRNISQCGLLHRLCVFLTLTNIPNEILAETINTIGEVIRGNNDNQQFFLSVINTTSDDQQPLINSLVYTMIVREKQLLKLRLAILYCLQCYLYKNDYGRSLIIQTLLPQNENAAHQYTLGHLLIVGLMSKDIVASWCSSIALAHLIMDHQQFKEALLQVVVNVDDDQTRPKSLMEISIDLLENLKSTIQTRIAILIFLSTWLANCPLAVQNFLILPTSTSYLISQICLPSNNDDRDVFISSLCSFTFGLCLIFNNNQISTSSSESLERIVQKRIGVEIFQDKLESLSKTEIYSKTLQRPQIQVNNIDEMLLDYEFARLYKILEGSITKSLTAPKQTQSTNVPDPSSNLLVQYYQYIQQQNQAIQFYQEQEKQFQEERKFYQTKMAELENSRNYFQHQNGLILNGFQKPTESDQQFHKVIEQQKHELDFLRNQLNQQNLTNEISKLDKTLQSEQFHQGNLTSNDENLVEQLRQFQLTNRILEEKLVNEQRKVSILQGLENQIEELIDEKVKLNDEYQRLNLTYEKNLEQQKYLYQLCSNYQNQLKQTRFFLDNAGLKIPDFLVEIEHLN